MGFPVPGGSVLVCCTLDDIATTPHGYVRQYHLYKDLIRQQLAQMYANGQRRLGIAIAYYPGGDTFALDSTAGLIATQDAANLTGLIYDAVGVGFGEFVIEMIPESTAAYTNWLNPLVMGDGNTRAWQPLVYQMCLSFTLAIDALVAQIVAATVPEGIAEIPPTYHMDLCAECENTEFASRLWVDWCALKGPVGFGFSMISAQRVIDLLPSLYTNGLEPAAIALHWYAGSPGELSFTDFKAGFRATGRSQAFCVTEMSTNDPTQAAALAADKADLFWCLQWPVLQGVTPPKVTQDRLTTEYSAYAAVGL